MLFPYSKAVCWVLSVVMFAGSGTPSGFRHSHSGGNESHEHGNAGAAVAFQPSEHSHHDHRHSDSTDRFLLSAADDSSHVHTSWLGLDFHWPASENPTTHEGDDGLPSSIILIFAGQSYMPRLAGLPPPGCSVAYAALPTDAAIVPDELTESSPAQVASPPLCDNARHERSGVQLV